MTGAPAVRRVLLVHDYAGLEGGAEFLVQDLRKALRARGVDARLVAGDLGQGSRADETFAAGTGPARALREVMNPSMIRTVRRTLRAFRPEVVQLGMIQTQVSPWILPLVGHLPVVWMPNTYRPVCPSGSKLLPDGRTCDQPAGMGCRSAGCFSLKGIVPRLIQLRLLHRWRAAVDRLVAPSRAFAGILEAGGWPVDAVIPHAVAEVECRADPGPTPVVGYAGRLAPEKGVETLLRAFVPVRERLPGAELWILGDGPQRGRLEELARALHPEGAVTFTGHLARTNVQRRLSRAWLQAVPSVWPEPFGLVTVEAMLRGTPVVASAVGAQPEIVRDGDTGVLVPPARADLLGEALTSLLTDPDRLRAMGRRGRERALSCYTMATMTDAFLDLYGTLVDAPCPTGRS